MLRVTRKAKLLASELRSCLERFREVVDSVDFEGSLPPELGLDSIKRTLAGDVAEELGRRDFDRMLFGDPRWSRGQRDEFEDLGRLLGVESLRGLPEFEVGRIGDQVQRWERGGGAAGFGSLTRAWTRNEVLRDRRPDLNPSILAERIVLPELKRLEASVREAPLAELARRSEEYQSAYRGAREAGLDLKHLVVPEQLLRESQKKFARDYGRDLESNGGRVPSGFGTLLWNDPEVATLVELGRADVALARAKQEPHPYTRVDKLASYLTILPASESCAESLRGALGLTKRFTASTPAACAALVALVEMLPHEPGIAASRLTEVEQLLRQARDSLDSEHDRRVARRGNHRALARAVVQQLDKAGVDIAYLDDSWERFGDF
jgi:hypothetical protein